MYRNVTKLCMLIFYPATLLNLLMGSENLNVLHTLPGLLPFHIFSRTDLTGMNLAKDVGQVKSVQESDEGWRKTFIKEQYGINFQPPNITIICKENGLILQLNPFLKMVSKYSFIVLKV